MYSNLLINKRLYFIKSVDQLYEEESIFSVTLGG